MKQGLSSAEDGILLIKTKTKQTTKSTPWGKNSAGNLTSWAGSGHNQRTHDDKLAQDYKHKENK